MAGTPRKVTLDGVTYNVAADANFTQNPGIEKEMIRHTGGNTPKSTLMTESVEGVDLIVDGNQYEDLKELGKRNISFPMSYELESGDVYRATGQISLSARESETTKCTVTLLPDFDWKPFLV